MPTCGIYAIRHRVTGKTYIGLSRNIERRWSKHRSQIDAIKPCKRTVRLDASKVPARYRHLAAQNSPSRVSRVCEGRAGRRYA